MTEPQLHVVLHEPLIPQNTGSVGRLCVGTQSRLHLVEPLGFDISEKAVRRAGLDYWQDVDLRVHPDLASCLRAIAAPTERIFVLSASATRSYTEVAFAPGDVLVFGRETTGLDRSVLEEAGARALAVPRFGPIRSFNLATTVGVVVYEALRQIRPDALPGPPTPRPSPLEPK